MALGSSLNEDYKANNKSPTRDGEMKILEDSNKNAGVYVGLFQFIIYVLRCLFWNWNDITINTLRNSYVLLVNYTLLSCLSIAAAEYISKKFQPKESRTSDGNYNYVLFISGMPNISTHTVWIVVGTLCLCDYNYCMQEFHFDNTVLSVTCVCCTIFI